MPRLKRIAKGDVVYHVLNRANGRLRIFKKRRDFEAFEEILGEGAERVGMRVCGYCIMSNHWHTSHGTVGIGHVYQGRFKSFPVQSNAYYLTLMQYVESNPVRAGLVDRSGDWAWSSLAVRKGEGKAIALSDGPVELPRQWAKLVDKAARMGKDGRELIELCVRRSRPLGNEDWSRMIAVRLGLEATLRPRGRPKKGV